MIISFCICSPTIYIPEPAFHLSPSLSPIYWFATTCIVFWPFWTAPAVPASWIISTFPPLPFVTFIAPILVIWPSPLRPPCLRCTRPISVSTIMRLSIRCIIVLTHYSRAFILIVFVSPSCIDFKIVLKLAVCNLSAFVWSLLMDTLLCLFLSSSSFLLLDITFCLSPLFLKDATVIGGLESFWFSICFRSAFKALTSLSFRPSLKILFTVYVTISLLLSGTFRSTILRAISSVSDTAVGISSILFSNSFISSYRSSFIVSFLYFLYFIIYSFVYHLTKFLRQSILKIWCHSIYVFV